MTPSPVAAVEPVACTPQQMRTIHMLVAALLEYPEERFTPAIAASRCADLPEGVRAHLARSWTGQQPP